MDATRHLDVQIYHPRADFLNGAFWTPRSNTVIFGNIDPRFFNPFIDKVDILAHEFAHGTIQFSSNLTFAGQSGALNDSCADIMGIIAKHTRERTGSNEPTTDWLLGNGCVKNRDGTVAAFRSFSHPGQAYQNHQILGTDGQVSHMNAFIPCPLPNVGNDFGYIHLNSGIPNHAFYLTATRMGGDTYARAGRIWAHTMTAVEADEDFNSFAAHTMRVARELRFNEGDINIVGQAWTAVGVRPGPRVPPPAPPPVVPPAPQEASSEWSPWWLLAIPVVAVVAAVGVVGAVAAAAAGGSESSENSRGSDSSEKSKRKDPS